MSTKLGDGTNFVVKKNPPLMKWGIRPQRTVDGGRFFRGSVSWGSPVYRLRLLPKRPSRRRLAKPMSVHICLSLSEMTSAPVIASDLLKKTRTSFTDRGAARAPLRGARGEVLSRVMVQEAEVTSDVYGLRKQGLPHTAANSDLKYADASTVGHAPLIRVSIYWTFIWAGPHA